MVLSGIASLLFGVALLINPSVGAVAVVWIIGAYAMVFGVLLLALSFKLRGLEHRGLRNTGLLKIARIAGLTPVWFAPHRDVKRLHLDLSLSSVSRTGVQSISFSLRV